jgi:gamma-glutamylcyclotransferase (GGCT)/AIG2-like uncharacterized protein YtfP
MAKEKKFNLFVYGSLNDPNIFKSVSSLGFTRKAGKVDEQTLFADSAILPRHRKVSPDNVYFYAVTSPSSKIEGLLIYDIPAKVMAEIDKYEGKRYQRETVYVNTAKGRVKAQAYLVSHDSMEKNFGDRFHVNLIHELWLRKRIEKFIKKHTRPGEHTADAEAERRAERELLATTERDLVMSHYGVNTVSDYYIEQQLGRPRPSIKNLYDDPLVKPFIENYLALVVRQVMLNQLDDLIQNEYRYELEHIRTSERYFKRTLSLVIALQVINTNKTAVDLIVQKCLQTIPYKKNDLFDYVKFAVIAATSMFDGRVIRAKIDNIRSNLQTGLTPLGLEIELKPMDEGRRMRDESSILNLPSSLVTCDPVYDGFRYYFDFSLDVFSWKLGGYIDDHSGSGDRTRRCGFLELAPGRLNLEGQLSRPATADPWLLNQLINEIVDFYTQEIHQEPVIRPHSLHLSLQLQKKQIGRQKTLPLDFVKCLLVLGGGPSATDENISGTTSGVCISRITNNEIIQKVPIQIQDSGPREQEFLEELAFARTSKRNWYMGSDEMAQKIPAQARTVIQQYKFIRLEKRTSYEPLIMCLKGLQLAINPGDYLTYEQLAGNPKLQEQYEELKRWARHPTEISRSTIRKFIHTVEQGLMNERHYKPAHKLHYINWALSTIDMQLRMFNQQLKPHPNQ